MRIALLSPMFALLVGAAAACGARVAESDGADASIVSEDAHLDSESTNEAAASDGGKHDGGDACHPGECTESACACTADTECCSGSCREGFCVGMLFCGSMQCYSPYDYCRTSGGADASYECRKLPADCIGNWTCACVMAGNPCGSADASVTCDDHDPGNVFVVCP